MAWLSHIEAAWLDVRHAVRLMVRQPGFTAIAVLILTLGIGINTAIFSLADGMLFRPLPFADPDRLVQIMSFSKGQAYALVPRAFFLHLRAHHSGFEDIAAAEDVAQLRRTGPHGIELFAAASSTPNLLDLLGVRPHLGRTLRPGEDEVALPRRAMLTYSAWRQRFGGDPGIVGRVISFEQRDVEIVGVLPRQFIYPIRVGSGELLFVRDIDPSSVIDSRIGVRTPVARLKPGVTVAQAQAETDVLVRQAAHADSSTAADDGLRVAGLQYSLFERNRHLLWLLVGTAGIVLLLACANLASLLLARGMSREQELGIRSAVGASRRRLVCQLLIESLLLGVTAGIVALVAAWAAFHVLRDLAPAARFDLMPPSFGGRTVVFTLFLAIASSVVFGILPALRGGRSDATVGMRAQQILAARGPLLRGGAQLVFLEVVLCVILVAATALTTHSLARMLLADLGFAHVDAVAFSVGVPSTIRSAGPAAQFEFRQQVLEAVRQHRAVRAAGAIDVEQVGNQAPWRGFSGNPWPDATGVWSVTPGYFSAMGIPIVRGRDFSDDDMRRDAPVVIVSASIARALWGTDDPLGRIVVDEGTPLMVIGVVKDIRGEYGGSIRPSVYRTLSPRTSLPWRVVAFGPGSPEQLAAAVREVAHRSERRLSVSAPRPLSATLTRSIEDSRFITVLFLLFGVIALLVTAAGIYGVMACWVSTRTRELGVRLALGADAGMVERLVIRQAAAPLAAGLLAGLASALVLTRQLESLLYEIAPNDPATLGVAVAVLLSVGLYAAYVPARRAARVDPVVALRTE